jgi:prepilin peptidase CpaA
VNPSLISTPLAVVLFAAVIAAVTDIWKFRVYNALTLPLIASGLLFHVTVGQGIGDSLLGMLFGFGTLVVLYLVGGMGAGDVKLMAGVGAWLGMKLTFYVFIASSISAGIYAVVLMILGGRLIETVVNLQILVHRMATLGKYLGSDDRVEAEVIRPDRRRRIIPFGAMVAVGVVATLLYLQLS